MGTRELEDMQRQNGRRHSPARAAPNPCRSQARRALDRLGVSAAWLRALAEIENQRVLVRHPRRPVARSTEPDEPCGEPVVPPRETLRCDPHLAELGRLDG